MMTPDAQVSLMLALSEVSSRTLAAAQQQSLAAAAVGQSTGPLGAGSGAAAATGGVTGAASSGLRMSALNRMVEVLMYNLPRIQVQTVAVVLLVCWCSVWLV